MDSKKIEGTVEKVGGHRGRGASDTSTTPPTEIELTPAEIVDSIEGLGNSLKTSLKSEFIIEVKLPTLGKAHTFGDTINLRPMKTTEEKYFSTMAGKANAHKIISQLIKSCSDIPIDPIDLIIDDRLYILFKLRSITYGNIYNIDIACSACETKYTYNYNIDSSEIRYLTGDLNFEANLPVSGDKLLLRRITGRDELAVMNYEKQVGKTKREIKRGPDSNDTIEGDDSYIYRLALQIYSVNGIEIKGKERLSYVENLYGKDSLMIRQSIDDNSLGLELRFIAECPNCGADNETLMPMTPEFFRPRV
jgi:hypothetical protein